MARILFPLELWDKESEGNNCTVFDRDTSLERVNRVRKGKNSNLDTL
jgi:hypothetical protein